MADKTAFKFDNALPIPEVTRGARSSEMALKLTAMKDGQSFLEGVTVPDTIKDAAERDKIFKETARSTANRLSGVVRRFAKNNPGTSFAVRVVNDDALGHGVRVWKQRTEKATPPA